MKNQLIICIALLFGIFNLNAQVSSGSITHGGQNRTYLVYLPTTYTQGSNLPLVFVLHGLTQTGQGIMQTSGFNAVAENNNFIAVYPNGIGNAWNVGFTLPGASTADDVGFIETLVDEMDNLYGINLNRVYSCGFSNGGFMSYKLACESSKCFAAVASVAGVITDAGFASCTPSRSVPVMQIHGTADAIVPYNGLPGFKTVNEVLAFWLFNNNNCSGNPTITPLPNTFLFDFSTVDRFSWTPCDDGAEVELLRVNGGGHQWPGTTSILGGLGTINRDINASREIWGFFERFACNQVGVNPIPVAPTVTALPAVVCLGTSSALTAISPGGDYEWFNTAIGGAPVATGANFTTPPLLVSTTYWVQTTDQNGFTSARTPVTVTVDVNPLPLAPIVTALPPVVCSGGVAVLTSTLPVLGTINWYDAATGGNLLGTGAVYVTPQLTATTTYWAEPVRGNCIGPRTAVNVVVNPLPPAPAVAASSSTVCLGTPVTLSATGTGSGILSWYNAPTGGFLLWIGANYTVVPLTTTTYYVQETDANGCSSARTPVTVTVNPLPAIPTASAIPASGCAGNTSTLSASAPGGFYEWFDLPVGGTLIDTGASITTPVLTVTTVYWVQTTDANGCVSLRAPVTVIVEPLPLAPLVTALPARVCAGNPVVLTSTLPLLGTINWYDAAIGGNLLGSGATYTTTPLNATTTFWAEPVRGACVGPRTAMTVIVNPIPAAPTVTPALPTVCFGGSATLTATAPGGIYRWYRQPTGGFPIALGTSLTTPALFTDATYYVSTIVGGCVSQRTAVTVVVNPLVGAPRASAAPASICPGDTAVITAVVAGNNLVEWFVVPTGGTPIATGLTFTTPALTFTTTYWVGANDGAGCASFRTPVTVNVIQAPALTAIARPSIVCTGWISVLSVRLTGGSANWYDAPAGGNLLGTGNFYVTPPLTATTTFYVEAVVQGCTGPRTPITVTLGACKMDEQIAPSEFTEDDEPQYFSVYPNPTDGIFTIDFRRNETQMLRIYDAGGKNIFSKEYGLNNQFEIKEAIDLSGYSKGIYFIQLQGAKGSINRKLMLK